MAAARLLSNFLSKSSLFSIRRSAERIIYPLTLQEQRRQICIQSVIAFSKPYQNPKVVAWAQQTQRLYSTDSPTQLEQKVLECIRQYDKLGEKATELTLESRFKEDMSMDSLDHIEMIMLVEDEFGIEIPETVSETLDTPAKVAAYLDDKGVVVES